MGFKDEVPSKAACYRFFSQLAFPPDSNPVQIRGTTVPAPPWTGKDQAMNMQAPLRLEQSSRPLEDRLSLVTGSTGGIGLGTARALAAAGFLQVLRQPRPPSGWWLHCALRRSSIRKIPPQKLGVLGGNHA